ncbi:hypothetical protein PGT21_036459 [Puccinia graminis f. sp. tritici]|uniref:Uncharacterized protein n=1 Tax=Puccinia graminis f. sp. tritici TaxID=56615 RepID=A0A5B0Q093_PUCGR|nr:hypothetical protein PGT21_036459 [Puccinia graminis f. sp. tritici]
MQIQYLLIGLFTTSWCRKDMINPVVDEKDYGAIQDLDSSSTPQYQRLGADVMEEIDPERPKITISSNFQGLNSDVDQSASKRQQIAHYVPSPDFNCVSVILSKFWERNHDQVISLDKDWEEILGMQIQKRC